jgi:hypothetical protein
MSDELVEFADGLRLVAVLEALLELGRIKSSLGVACAQTLGYLFTIGVGGAKGVAALFGPSA